MSKRVKVGFECTVCTKRFEAELYRSLWIEELKNRTLVFSDKINTVSCPCCQATTKVNYPFLCTNVKQKFAVWYEPYPDSLIDQDVEFYTKNFGRDSFYAKAPRISDWNEFKDLILLMEKGQYKVGGDISLSPELVKKTDSFLASIKRDNSSNGFWHKLANMLRMGRK